MAEIKSQKIPPPMAAAGLLGQEHVFRNPIVFYGVGT